MLKKILIAIVVLVAGFAGYVAMQPSEFHVERTATIAAPPANVFQHVDDLHKWDAWSPWAKLDPNAKTTFEGPASGNGAVFAWSGNDEVGEGKMTILDSRPDEAIKIKTEFVKPFPGSSTSGFTFKPEGDKTVVTWNMQSEQPFLMRAMCIIFNGKKMIGDQFDKGLSNLKTVVEKAG